MNSPRIKNEGWLYGLAFLIALGFRFIQLGASPLTDSEAALALQALHVAEGKAPLLGPHPAYILFTSLFFAVIEATNFMARLLPAFVGSAIVFAPWFFRERIKPRTALILAFLFAFDPGLVALSRQAGGTILAVTFTLFAWGMWKNRLAVPFGIFAGLALLSGPSVWAGLLTLGLTWLFLQGLRPKPAPEESQIASPHLSAIELRPAMTAFAVTILIGGTLFFVSPNGLSAWLSSLPAYLTGWTSASLASPARTLLTFLAYEPLGLFLAGFFIVRGVRTKGRRALQLGLWLGVALLLAVFYRQPAELVWAVIPLLTMGAFELSRAFDIQPAERMETGVVTIAIILLLVYIWFNILNVALNPYGQASAIVPIFGAVTIPRSFVFFGSFAIIVICIALVALGWSARTAWLGSIWAFTFFLGIYSMGTAWGASGLRTPDGVELWNLDPKPLQADLLLASVEQVSELSTGDDRSQPVTVMGIDSPALEWLLRNHPVDVVTILDPQSTPPLLVTPVMDDPNLPAAYRGQDFIWRRGPVWDTLQNLDRLTWLVFRKLPLENETIILWARDDLFPDARETMTTP